MRFQHDPSQGCKGCPAMRDVRCGRVVARPFAWLAAMNAFAPRVIGVVSPAGGGRFDTVHEEASMVSETGWSLHPDRALPSDPVVRPIAREILASTADLPIVSMHGHVDAGLLARDEPFPDPASLLVTPDHYLV